MSDLERLARLRAIVQQAVKDADRAEGMADGVRKMIKEEFGCKNDREVEERLSDLISEKTDLERALGRDLDRFEKDYGGRLT